MDVLYAVTESEMYHVGEIDIESSRPFVISLDERLSDLPDIVKILGRQHKEEFNSYKKIQDFLNLSNKETLATIPTDKRNEYIRNTFVSLKNALSDLVDISYIETYVQSKQFLRQLNRPTVDIEKIKSLGELIQHDHIFEKVKDFGSSTEKTQYSMSGTVTGRLTVTTGPNILTLPSSVRGCIKSKYEGGKILQIDLISAEPYMALLMTGQIPPDDIYQHIAEVILDKKVTRSQAKLITLSALYGQSSRNLEKSLPKEINARSVIENTKRYFKISVIKEKLKTDMKNRRFRNVLGRPIKLDSEREDLLISYFLQSSVAECSIVAFDNFFNGTSLNVCPYYVIHDALIFDADHEASNYLLNLGKIPVNAGTWLFKAKVTQVSDI